MSATPFSIIAVLLTVCPCLDNSNIYVSKLLSLQIIKIFLLIKSNIPFKFVWFCHFECNAILNLPYVCSLQLVNKRYNRKKCMYSTGLFQIKLQLKPIYFTVLYNIFDKLSLHSRGQLHNNLRILRANFNFKSMSSIK